MNLCPFLLLLGGGALAALAQSSSFTSSSADGSKLVAGVAGGQIYTSTDSGTNWTAREGIRQWFSASSAAKIVKHAGQLTGSEL